MIFAPLRTALAAREKPLHTSVDHVWIMF